MDGCEEPVEDVVCSCCCELITPVIHVICQDCEAKLCVPCFRMGAEVGKHKRGHSYKVCDKEGRPTFEKKGAWGHLEERKLLDAAHKYKLGNWSEMRQMMKTTRSQNECIVYYDTYFIRGPIGRFALRDLEWKENEKDYWREGYMQELLSKHNSDDMRFNLYLAALRWKKNVTLKPDDENLKDEIRKIAKEYVKHFEEHDAGEPSTSHHVDFPLSPAIRCNRELRSVDPMDPFSDREEEPEEEDEPMDDEPGPSHVHTNGRRSEPLKPEMSDDSFHSFREETPLPAIKVVLKKVDKGEEGDSYIVASDSYRDAREAQSESNSGGAEACSDEEMADTSCFPEGDEREDSLLTEDDLHGLEKEMSSESEDSDREPPAKKARLSKTSTPKTVKKKKKVWKSKKQRRLESFQKRQATKARKREQELEKHEEIVSKETIAATRIRHQPLALYRSRPRVEKPKFRQDDCVLLSYNCERNDYELESYNDAETLISQLTIAMPRVNNEMINFENNVKFARIQKYKRALMVRNARRNAIVEHDKITKFFDFMKAMTMEKRKASQILEQRSPIEKINSRITQTLNKEEHTRFTDRVEKFQELKDRIERLQELQRQGVTSLKGCDLGVSPKKKKTKGNSETKRKAGLRWKAIQRQHLKMAAE